MEDMIEIKPANKKLWLKYGLAGGIVSSLIILGAYVISPEILTKQNSGISIATFFVLILCGFLAALEKRRQQHGYILFGNAMGTSVSALVTGVVIFTIVLCLIYFVLDSSLVDLLINNTIAKLEDLKDAHPDKAQIFDMSINSWQKNGHFYVMLNTLATPLIVTIFGLIVYLITSAIIKKTPKV